LKYNKGRPSSADWPLSEINIRHLLHRLSCLFEVYFNDAVSDSDYMDLNVNNEFETTWKEAALN
jgi:hypothetical protein